jgi:uncharacterized PurR-regulated membrane protein YhhQ (DUF165 family)
MMKQELKHKIVETQKETPILSVLIVLGLLSFLTTFLIIDLQNESWFRSEITSAAGLICGLFALPLGLNITCIPLFKARIQNSMKNAA